MECQWNPLNKRNDGFMFLKSLSGSFVEKVWRGEGVQNQTRGAIRRWWPWPQEWAREQSSAGPHCGGSTGGLHMGEERERQQEAFLVRAARWVGWQLWRLRQGSPGEGQVWGGKWRVGSRQAKWIKCFNLSFSQVLQVHRTQKDQIRMGKFPGEGIFFEGVGE